MARNRNTDAVAARRVEGRADMPFKLSRFCFLTLSGQSPCLSCCCIGEVADTMPPDLEDVDATTQIYYPDR
jgi:hypothetical protein